MRTTLIALVAASLLGLAGCPRDQGSGGGGRRSEDKRLEVGRVTTELHAFGADAEPIELSTSLDGIVRTALGTTKMLRMVEGSDGASSRGARLRVRAVVSPDGATGELHAIVSARLDRTGSIPLTADLDAVRRAEPGGAAPDTKVYATHLEKAVRDAIKTLDDQVAVLAGSNDSLVKALSSADSSVRISAVRELGERRAREAVEPLCGLLGEEHGRVEEAALGALTAIGDPEAVPCIIHWAGTEDRRVVLVIDPLAALGGGEAQAYLQMIATGHENPGIRQVAERALERAREKATGGARP